MFALNHIGEFRHSDVGPGLDGADQKPMQRLKLAAARAPLRRRLQRASLAVTLHQADHATWGHIELQSGASTRMARVYEIKYPNT
jgi:hypothetical protein